MNSTQPANPFTATPADAPDLMLYQIVTGTPRRDMGGFGFEIRLWPAWKDLVAEWPHDQKDVNRAIESLGDGWLDACGYGEMYDPDADPLDMWKERHLHETRKLGPNAKRLYEARYAIRVSWGEWGPEHITVPGNACGLDLSRGLGGPEGGMTLFPHNVDAMCQAYLLMLVFNWFADALILHRTCKKMRRERP